MNCGLDAASLRIKCEIWNSNSNVSIISRSDVIQLQRLCSVHVDVQCMFKTCDVRWKFKIHRHSYWFWHNFAILSAFSEPKLSLCVVLTLHFILRTHWTLHKVFQIRSTNCSRDKACNASTWLSIIKLTLIDYCSKIAQSFIWTTNAKHTYFCILWIRLK